MHPTPMMAKCEFVDFEIHYIAESKVGDQLNIYKKIEENYVLFEIRNDEKVYVKAKLNYKVKNQTIDNCC